MRTGVRFLVLLAVLLLTFGISHAQTDSCRAYLVVAVSPIDLVGGGEALSPDGSPDAHFRLHITAPGKSLTSLELRNTSGQYSVWDTITGNGMWVIAVVKGKERINAPDGGIKLDLSQDEEILDLYVQDNGSITGGGTNYKLTLMFGDGSKVSIPVGTTGAVTQETPAPSQPSSGPSKVIFDNWNKEAVSNSPARSTRFTVDRQTTITSIRNYHWNNMNGREPGMIALIGSDGAIYGPWSTVGTSGTGGARNVNWEAKPNVSIPQGTYTVIDSDIATWSHNPSSGGSGFSCVTAEGSSASLQLEKSAFSPGEEIKVFFTAPPGLVEGSAWIGIIPSNVQHGSELVNDQHDMTYQRFKGTSGSLIFKAPEQPGSYDFRMNDSDSGGREIASVTFVVK